MFAPAVGLVVQRGSGFRTVGAAGVALSHCGQSERTPKGCASVHPCTCGIFSGCPSDSSSSEKDTQGWQSWLRWYMRGTSVVVENLGRKSGFFKDSLKHPGMGFKFLCYLKPMLLTIEFDFDLRWL